MGYEFTVDEIREVVRAARLYSPGLTEEQFQVLRELEGRLQESGYLEAVQSLACLEQEKGVTGVEALVAFKQLLSDKERLEAEVASLEEKKTLLQEENQQVKAAVDQAKERLQAVQAEHQKEEKELIAFKKKAEREQRRIDEELIVFKKKAEREQRRIDEELERSRREANVTKEEVVIAGRLKAGVGEHGFSLDLALGLAQEFAGYEDIRDKLAEGLKRGLTLTKCNEEAEEQNETLQSDKKGLTGECQQLGSSLSQLRANEAFEKELRRFYHRYQGAEGLLECLASWDAIYFVRCTNPVFAVTGAFVHSAGGAYFWTNKSPTKCPHCGMAMLQPDEKPYLALNWPVGEPVKLQLRE